MKAVGIAIYFVFSLVYKFRSCAKFAFRLSCANITKAPPPPINPFLYGKVCTISSV
jgi:hypothetical protein